MNQSNPAENPTVADKIEYARTQIFNFQYPLFDPSQKQDFETKFIYHFYTRSLGFETPALFLFKLEEAIKLVMPYYNEFLKYQIADLDPFQDIDITEIFERTLNTDTTENNNVTVSNTTTTENNTTDKKTGTDTVEASETMDDTVNRTGTQTMNVPEQNSSNARARLSLNVPEQYP